MEKKSKNKRNNKFISRFRVNRTAINPEQHTQPQTTYFNKIGSDKSILTGGFTKNRQYSCFEQNMTHRSKHMSQQSEGAYIPTSKVRFLETVSIFNQTRRGKLDLQRSKITQKPLKIINLSQATRYIQKQPEQKTDPKSSYMSYLQYEQLINYGLLQAEHFLKIAENNDSKLESQCQSSQQFRQSQTPIKKFNVSQLAQHQQTITKHRKRRTHTEMTDLKPKGTFDTIISSNIGALSNNTIRQKLQDRWQEQQKNQNLKQNVTEDSEMGSEKDTKQVSVRQDAILWDRKRKQQELILPSNKNFDLQKVPNQPFKKYLRKILLINESARKPSEQRLYSQGQEYNQHEDNMMKFHKIYEAKKLELKHKLKWRI